LCCPHSRPGPAALQDWRGDAILAPLRQIFSC
jgi:hypothetical protein